MKLHPHGFLHLIATVAIVTVAAYIESAFHNMWLGALVVLVYVLGTFIGSVTEKYFSDQDPI